MTRTWWLLWAMMACFLVSAHLFRGNDIVRKPGATYPASG